MLYKEHFRGSEVKNVLICFCWRFSCVTVCETVSADFGTYIAGSFSFLCCSKATPNANTSGNMCTPSALTLRMHCTVKGTFFYTGQCSKDIMYQCCPHPSVFWVWPCPPPAAGCAWRPPWCSSPDARCRWPAACLQAPVCLFYRHKNKRITTINWGQAAASPDSEWESY